MLHHFFDWLQNSWGVDQTVYGRSFSQALHESLNFWGLLEGTHLLTVMLFFGTIMVVDLRLLGVAFRKTPISVVSERLLSMTVFAMVLLIITGVMLFFAKPEEYWHNIWFRTKMVLLVVAIANVGIFHKLVQKNQAEWDAAESPPAKAKLSAVISLASWILVIACGRFIAYNWFECGKPQPDWVNAAQGCAVSNTGMMTLTQDEALGPTFAKKPGAEAAPAEAAPAPATPAADIFAKDPVPPGADAAAAPAAKPEAK